jgi:thiazole synthase
MTDVRITVNGEARIAGAGSSVAALIASMGVDPARVAIERNEEVVPRKTWSEARVQEGDRFEIVAFVGGGSDDPLVIAGRTFQSRLLIGTGKYKSVDETRRAIDLSGAEIVTVALRRMDLSPGAPSVLDAVDRKRHTLLPNTAGCYTVEEAVRTCRLARELGMADMVKLEVIGDPQTLFPDGAATLEAARILVKENFVVLPYCLDDPILVKKLEEVGCAAVMPLGAPIGSGLGIRNPYNLRIILERAKVPIIVDAGVGTASDAAVAMELGCHGVLMNTAVAGARQPLLMAEAMREAVSAGRKAFRAGRIARKLYANASSPESGLIE